MNEPNEVDADFLHRISVELLQPESPEALHEKITSTAAALMDSDFASLQMLYPERGTGGELKLLSSRGFSTEATRLWEWVNADSACTCGVALRTGRQVVAPDIDRYDGIAGTPHQIGFHQTGIRAVQSTPLLSRSGRLIGMLSTHWRRPHAATEREHAIFGVFARHAADRMGVIDSLGGRSAPHLQWRPSRKAATLREITVLLVDNDIDTRDAYALLLPMYGAKVLVAASAAEATEVFLRERPDVVVCDIGMPGVDGYELIRTLRMLPAHLGGGVPAAALTGYADADSRLQALAAGFQMHIAKPVRPERLVALLARLCGRPFPTTL